MDYKPLEKAFDVELSDHLKHSINTKSKNDLHLYNYRQSTSIARNNPVLVKCRGIVIREDGKIVNYPFDRFFNDLEPNALK